MRPAIDVLTLTASEAIKVLENDITSEQLVNAYLTQIKAHNHNGMNLNALISVAPEQDLLERARALDQERRSGLLRSELHGVPFIAKDVFVTHPSLGMPTTVGNPCFATATARRTAPMIQHLLNAGMILLGKSNLTEFCGLKEPMNTPGWSPAGGQTQSPYIFGGLEEDEKLIGHSSATGSSSGTAAGVAAGFAPLGIGTECVGSVITPANRAALYALKAGLNAIDTEGCFKYTDCLDCIGGMAKSVHDLNLLVSAMMQRPGVFDVSGGLSGLRIAFLDPKIWNISEKLCSWPNDTRDQMETEYWKAKDRIARYGATVSEANDLSSAPEVFEFQGQSPFYEITFYQLANIFFPAWFREFTESEVHSVEDIIKYNESHVDTCLPLKLPKQGELHELVANSRTEAHAKAMKTEMQRRAHENLEKQFQSCDIIVAYADSSLCRYSSAAGLPIACMPLATLKYSEQNERPFGLCAVARSEQLLLRFMAAYEAVFPPRPLPRPLLVSTYA
ncbi:amidase signature domain-containing protein [Xylogone sp. PMI_703]|nr:amidase signature domain-containing protein [Xylogone sp. PMI_703]